jgi:hypothetical protein
MKSKSNSILIHEFEQDDRMTRVECLCPHPKGGAGNELFHIRRCAAISFQLCCARSHRI